MSKFESFSRAVGFSVMAIAVLSVERHPARLEGFDSSLSLTVSSVVRSACAHVSCSKTESQFCKVSEVEMGGD